MTLFGTIKTGHDVEEAATSTLETWMTTYLAEMERVQGLDPKTLPVVKNWIRANEFATWPEDKTPVGLVISPGLVDKPHMDGQGNYAAAWALGVAVVVSAKDRASTNQTAKLYAAAVRAALLQNRSLGNFSNGLTWEDERYDDVPSSAERTLGAVQLIFRVEVSDVTCALAGLVTPPDDPYEVPGSWPTADTVEVTVQNLED